MRPTQLPFVRGQESGQGGERFIGSLLGYPIGTARDDRGLHVIRGELHFDPDLFSHPVPGLDGEDSGDQACSLRSWLRVRPASRVAA
jgi:hypothetical protein